MFGIEMAPTPQPKHAAASKVTTKPSTRRTMKNRPIGRRQPGRRN
jgi:hypothetical protein